MTDAALVAGQNRQKTTCVAPDSQYFRALTVF